MNKNLDTLKYELIEDITAKKNYETTPENLFTEKFITELNSTLNMHGNSGEKFQEIYRNRQKNGIGIQ